ncbi:MAG: ATP-binding protein [Pseudomonadota bacterium]
MTIPVENFTGRALELRKLKDLVPHPGPRLVVITGRRRVGKSRLIQEFASNSNQCFFSFSGLAPVEGVTDQTQRDAFGRQLAQLLNIAPVTFTDWSDAFYALSQSLPANEPTVILLDEISWMAAKDVTFIPKLKVWWDLEMPKHPNAILVCCGSVSTWIEKNIIQSTAFFGRINLTMHLAPLSISESAELLKARGFKGSAYEIYKILAVTGGIPWYLEQIQVAYMADKNIQRLCFEKDGLLTTEFERIFHDLFNGAGDIYKKILRVLSAGMKTLSEIRQELGYANSGTLSKLMKHLKIAGFVSEHPQWSIATKKTSKQTLYRLFDSYTRFYLKYIEPIQINISQNTYQGLNLDQLINWPSILGLQVENLLLENRPLLLKHLDISRADIVGDNPYFQRATVKKKGCQIDYLVQTRTNNLLVCEFKCTRQEINAEIIEEMREKIKRLEMPRGMAAVPVLFHLGEVAESVYSQRCFYRIIDIGEWV